MNEALFIAAFPDRTVVARSVAALALDRMLRAPAAVDPTASEHFNLGHRTGPFGWYDHPSRLLAPFTRVRSCQRVG